MSEWGGISLAVGDRLVFGCSVFGWPKGSKFWLAPGGHIIPYPTPKAPNERV